MSKGNRLISRRTFLHGTALSAAGLCGAGPAFCGDSSRAVDRVHVIFKTHLDIGFTDLAERVVDKYLHDFIPLALRLAKETRERHGPQCFKWTTGSWLIHTCLERMRGAARKEMEEAITDGRICWHALPFTTHSEALDASLFEAGIQLSRRLDTRFGRTTLSGKMTDVPGHTRSIVPILAHNGIGLLHIGVNPASMPPDVPPVFAWHGPEGSRIAVLYQKDYGGAMVIPHTREAVAILFTGDNHGPQTSEQVSAAYDRLKREFPDAEIAASDLNAVAATVDGVLDRLPVVTGEVGDSWIHGIGSDPWKIARLRAMSRLRRDWLARDALQAGSDTDVAFSLPLAMVGEHTWGLDVKTHLQAWDIYTPEALQSARTTQPFQRIEASWQEKRDLLSTALTALPPDLQASARDTLDALRPLPPDLDGFEPMTNAGRLLETPALSLALDPATGAITHLQQTGTGRLWASPQHPLALFAWQCFSKADYDRFMEQYLTAQPDWALHDFGKPGLEAFVSDGRTCLPRLKTAWHKESEKEFILVAEMEVLDETGAVPPGCPRRLFTEYRVSKTGPAMNITFKWFEKPASRLPEALWLSFVPNTETSGAWLLDKMGQPVDPRGVVRNGGHKMHAVDSGVQYADKNGTLKINSLDAPLVAPAARSLLHFDNALPEVSRGMHFCLCNNVWGTNFVMWFDEDMQFRFQVTCQAPDNLTK